MKLIIEVDDQPQLALKLVAWYKGARWADLDGEGVGYVNINEPGMRMANNQRFFKARIKGLKVEL